MLQLFHLVLWQMDYHKLEDSEGLHTTSHRPTAGKIPQTSLWRTQSCHQVNLPWLREVGQALRTCNTVGWLELQRLHLESAQNFQRRRLRGVGIVSKAARRMKESWLGGRPSITRFHTLFLLSREHTSPNFL